MTTPIQRSLFLADYVSRDSSGGKWFAIGIYEQILCQGFPSEPRTLFGLASIGDISGLYGVDIIITDPDDSEIAKQIGGQLQVSPGSVATMGFTIKETIFKCPGTHHVKIYMNGQLGAQIGVSVAQAAIHVK